MARSAHAAALSHTLRAARRPTMFCARSARLMFEERRHMSRNTIVACCFSIALLPLFRCHALLPRRCRYAFVAYAAFSAMRCCYKRFLLFYAARMAARERRKTLSGLRGGDMLPCHARFTPARLRGYADMLCLAQQARQRARRDSATPICASCAAQVRARRR